MDELSKAKPQSHWGIIFAGAVICLILFAMAVQRVIDDEQRLLREEAIGLSESLELRLHKASDIAIDTWLLHQKLDATMEELAAFNHEQLQAHPYVGAILHLMPSDWEHANYHPYGAADDMPVLMRHHMDCLENIREMPNREVLNAALMQAIDSGEEIYSEEAHLSSDERVFYLVHPFYRETGLTSAEARRAALETVVVVMLRPRKLLRGVGHERTDDLLYSGDTQLAEWRHVDNVTAGWMLPHLSVDHSFNVLQREYTLVVERPLYWRGLNLKLPILALILGLVISALMYALKRSYNARALALQERNLEIRRQVSRQTEELRRSKAELERQRFALDQHAIVSITDAAGNIIYVNDKFCEISGYQLDELIGKNHRLLKSEVHPPEFFAEMWRTISHGKVWNGVLCNRNKAGEHYWVSSTIVPFIDENGLPYQYVSIRTDISQEKAVEKALQDNEERLRRSKNFANIGTWDWNISSGELFWSERIAPLFGHEVGALETTYENFMAAVHPDDRELVSSAVAACVEGRAEYNIEHRVVWPDGQVRWLSEKGDVVRDENGSPQHMLGVVQDINDRKMAEQALNRFKSTLDVTDDCVFMFDAEEMRFFYVNKGATEQIGYDEAELMSMHPYDIKPDYDAETFRELIAPLMDGAGSMTFETYHRHKDGHDVPVEIALQYIAPEGEQARFVAIVRDITERKRMEGLLTRQKSLLDVLHNSISNFVVQGDFKSTVNQMLETLLEVTGSEYGFTGEVMWDDDGMPYLKTHALTNIAWNEETRKLYDEFAEKGFEFRNLDTLFGHVMTGGEPVMSNDPANDPRSGGLPKGHPAMNAFLGVPVYYGRDLVGMYGIANRAEGYDEELLRFLEPFDVTYGVIIHSKRMQELQERNREQLLEAKEEAILANKAKSDFLSSMSHELRTPMNAILGFAQLLEGEENLTADQRESVQDIGRAGQHLLELINEVLDLAKIEAGKMELSIEVVPLDDVMDAVKKLIMPLAAQRDIRLHLEPSCSRGLFIHADYTRVKQVLLNLLSNAVKYNREQGEVFVECREGTQGRLRIEVRDTGNGIPEGKLEKLFEAFNRLDADASVEGTGIGLVITRQLVELMGGDMGVQSEEGVGTTFWFELPRIEGEKVTVKEAPNPERGGAVMAVEGERTVLYVEDNPVNLKLVSKLIAKLDNLRMLSADEPVRGLELAAAELPDLILLDINLPGMSGFEVVRHLRDMEALREVPVIALSANAMAEDIEKGREAGFDDYLTKPINVKQFYAVLERYLGKDEE